MGDASDYILGTIEKQEAIIEYQSEIIGTYINIIDVFSEIHFKLKGQMNGRETFSDMASELRALQISLSTCHRITERFLESCDGLKARIETNSLESE